MTFSTVSRRAALLGLALGVFGCDVASFAADPKPIFLQTWNLPSSKTSISVAKIVPSNVSIYVTPGSNPKDTSAFLLTLNNTVFNRSVGADCPSCQALNGTNAVKPQFTLAAGSFSSLGQDVIAGALLDSSVVNYSVVNNLSFDPIRVRALSNPVQGYMIVLIHSGSLVLGIDSLNGSTTAFPAGSTINRSIRLTSGTVVGQITVDLTINSPSGDHLEFINANGTVNMTAVYSNVRTGNVRVNVINKPINNQPDTVDLKGLSKTITDHVDSASFEMGFDNPWPVSGSLNVNFDYAPPQTVAKTVALPAGATPTTMQVRSVGLSGVEMQKLFGNQVVLNMTGNVNSPAPVTVSPKQSVSITNRMILKIRTGG
jgi:hypothetical protein